MNVLGIETATTVCAAALAIDDAVVAEESREERYIHAEMLLPMLDAVLRRSGCRPGDLAGVAVSIGPGSFTGLRIGLSVAKGLAFAADLPIAAVPTLRALAQRVAGLHDTQEHILAVLDARRDEVYYQLFRRSHSGLEQLGEEQSAPVDRLVERIGDRAVTVTGEGAPKLAAQLQRRSREGKRGRYHFADGALAKCSAGTVALIGASHLREGRSEDPASLEPRYVSEFFTPQR